MRRSPWKRRLYALFMLVLSGGSDLSSLILSCSVEIQAQSVVRSVANTVLESLKNENTKDLDKKREIEEPSKNPCSGEQFTQLFHLSGKITDCDVDEAMADPNMERKEAEIDVAWQYSSTR